MVFNYAYVGMSMAGEYVFECKKYICMHNSTFFVSKPIYQK